MKKTKSVLTFIYFFICFSIFFTQTAYAYVDPATTAMVVQIVSGIFISLGIAFGVFRGKIFVFFRTLKVKLTQKKIEKSQKDKKNGKDN